MCPEADCKPHNQPVSPWAGNTPGDNAVMTMDIVGAGTGPGPVHNEPNPVSPSGILATQVVCLLSEGSVPQSKPVSDDSTLTMTAGKQALSALLNSGYFVERLPNVNRKSGFGEQIAPK